MSQTTAINFASLDEFLNNENSSEEEVKLWYEKLSEYEIDGSESPTEIELLYNAARYLMSFAFTAAEELRDVAEQEAVTMAEKEDQWEEQMTQLKEEIESLRERITSKAEIGDSTEAFRAQIDSLKEENRQLQQSNRDRDREMADQRDRFENLAARVDSVTRERDALTDHKTHLEDTIRELNRRLSSKTEEIGGDWESRKLKMRNEQVLTMSRQMEMIIRQNEELREEIEKVSDALEDATRIIEQSAHRYSELSQQFEDSQQKCQELIHQNKRLTDGLPDQLIEKLPKCMAAAEKLISAEPIDKINFLWQTSELLLPNFLNDDDYQELQKSTGFTAVKEMETKIERSEEKIKLLQEELSNVLDESNRLRLMIREDRTGEKEQELEQLKKELMTATTLARNLFGEAMTDVPGQDPTTILQMRILQLEQTVQQFKKKIEEQKQSIDELEFVVEKKDEKNLELLGELNRLKDDKFGSGRDEVDRLEKQLKYRDEQIHQMQQHSTLLQIELGRYADKTYEPPVKIEKMKRKSAENDDRKIEKIEEKIKIDVEEVEEVEEVSAENSKNAEQKMTNEKKKKKKKKSMKNSSSELAENAVLISNLYYEMMQILEELNMKDEQLIEVQKSWTTTKRINNELQAQLEMAYAEIKMLKKESTRSEEKMLEKLQNSESADVQRLIESINIGGDELERRMAEATRKLIAERVERIRFSRINSILRKKIDRLENAGKRAKQRLIEIEQEDRTKLINMKFELDLSMVEIGKLQNRLLQSVPVEEYDKLMRKYKNILKQITGIQTNNEQMSRQDQHQSIINSEASQEAESEAKENMLKKMIDVVTDQCEFWSREAGMLQAENEELKKFIEDIENENDLKSVLGAVERRLLDTIRELRENEREYLREKRKQRGVEHENQRDFERFKIERITLLNVINILQKENKMLRDQTMGSVSLQQLEILQTKIVEVKQNEEQIQIIKSEAEKYREEHETELLRLRATKAAREIVSNNEGEARNGDLSSNHFRQLQSAFFNSSQQSAKVKNCEKMIFLKEKKLSEIADENRELKQWNIELLTTIENLKDFWNPKRFGREIEDVKNETKIKIDKSIENVDRESDYEMDLRSDLSSNESSTSSARIIVRTIVQDNVEAFENRIQELSASAQVALQGYKEQLELKERAIQKYKQLLKEKIDEGDQIIEKLEIVQQEIEVPDKKTQLKLKMAEAQIRKLENEMKEMKTRRRRNEEEKAENELVEAESQTEPNEPQKAGNNEDFEQNDQINSAKSEKVQKLENEIQLMQEILSKQNEKENAEIRYKTEIRNLKSRIQRLTKINKELMSTCEQIKEDALSELSQFRKNNENVDEKQITDFRIEIEKLKSINRSLRTSNDQLKIEINKLKEKSIIKSIKKNEPSEWEKKKKHDEIIKNLNEKLKKKEQNEQDFLEKIEKRDKLIEMIRKDQSTRTQEIERLQRKLKELDPVNLKIQINQNWQQKVSNLEAILSRKENEIGSLTKNLQNVRSEFDNFKKNKRQEIEDLKRDYSARRRQERQQNDEIEQRTIKRSISIQTDLKKINKNDKNSLDNSTLNDEKKKLENDFKYGEYQQLKEILSSTQNRLIESQEKLINMEKDYNILREKFDRLQIRTNRDDKPTGAVLVLSDKLSAKDREIAQLKNQIAHFQRSVHLPI